MADANFFSLDWLVGSALSAVTHDPTADTWSVLFASGARLSVPSLWRLVRGGHLSSTSADHGHLFGSPEPFDALLATRELEGKTLGRVFVREGTGDLTLEFSDGLTLEVISTSAGFEGWFADHPVLGTVFLGAMGSYMQYQAPNPSIERTSQRPLRALCAAAHVER